MRLLDIGKVTPGCLLEHRGDKPPSASWFISRALKLFERWWDGWGWHLSIAWKKAGNGWYILEATGDGVEVNFYRNKYLFTDTRIYQWFATPPTRKVMDKFYREHIGKKYDVAIYFWTALQYLFRHFWNKRIPRLLDDRYTCWELVFEFCDEMGKPLGSKYDCPIITDFVKAMT